MAEASTKCPEKGCAGRVTVITDGGGGTRTTKCGFCEKRQVWAAKHLPPPPPRLCAICTAPIPDRRNRQYCDACRPLAEKAARLRERTTTKRKLARSA